jgi:hypothetical protein
MEEESRGVSQELLALVRKEACISFNVDYDNMSEVFSTNFIPKCLRCPVIFAFGTLLKRTDNRAGPSGFG